MEIRLADRADPTDLAGMARLLWSHAAPEEQARQSVEAFAVDLASWWGEHCGSHVAVVARDAEVGVVGMAWLALLPRVPRPGNATRRSGDLQSVFVRSEFRGRGLGSELVRATLEQAEELGVGRVTVGSSSRAVVFYERLGFASSPQLLERVDGGVIPPPGS